MTAPSPDQLERVVQAIGSTPGVSPLWARVAARYAWTAIVPMVVEEVAALFDQQAAAGDESAEFNARLIRRLIR